MSSLYLGVRLPSKPFERLKLLNIDLPTKNVAELKLETEKMLNLSHNELQFIYCGNILNNDRQTLESYGIRSGTMIHVYHKEAKVVYTSEPVTQEQVQKAVVCYRTILKELAMNALTKSLRPEVMRTIVEAYPEYNTNLAAYTFIRDSILIQSLTVLETATEIAKQYPVLIHSAEFIAQTVREHLAANKPNLLGNIQPTDDSLSDSSGSESDSPAATSPNRNRTNDIRQISRDQLSQALRLAGTASTNSLSNIAQRSSQSNQSATGSGIGGSSGSGIGAPSTSGILPQAAAPTTSTAITNSFLANALSQAILANSLTSATNQSATSQSQPQQVQQSQSRPTTDSAENHAERYANELQTMREMGLLDDLINIQALAVSNGDVEAAINLVLSGLGSSN